MATINSFQSKEPRRSLLSAFNNVRYEHLVAGVSGGLTSTLILHPLDLLKLRLAVHDGRKDFALPKYQGVVNGLRAIYRAEGVRGLYRGVTPNVCGSGSSWGLYFLFYTTSKSQIQGGDANVSLSPLMHLYCASKAGIMTLLLTNPIWVVKTRLCLQYMDVNRKSGPSVDVYSGMVDAIKKIYTSEGIRGLYKGIVPGIFGVSHGAVQFMVYEELKKIYSKQMNVPINSKFGNAEYLTFAATAKLVAVALTYPYQVLRARLQSQYGNCNSIVELIKNIWTFEGWKGFYKGLGANLVKVTPATMITFVTYENVSHFLTHPKDRQ